MASLISLCLLPDLVGVLHELPVGSDETLVLVVSLLEALCAALLHHPATGNVPLEVNVLLQAGVNLQEGNMIF